MASRRPEHTAPATEVYSEDGAKKYAASSRMNQVQTALAERAFELLALPDDTPALLLDVGTGTGLAGDVLTQAGHHWVGTDISEPMLNTALRRDVDGDLLHADAGDGVPFRMGVFDGCVSISAVQWLCNADRADHDPKRRMAAFFATLYASLRRSARAVLQFYPENGHQISLLTAAAMRAGFSGGLLVDYPNSAKAKKYFLVLTAGPPAKGVAQPKALGTDEHGAPNAIRVGARRAGKKGRGKADDGPSRKDRVIAKKDRRRQKGRDVRPDSKYTGRKRRVQF